MAQSPRAASDCSGLGPTAVPTASRCADHNMTDDHTIGWAERNGNRQYIGTGNSSPRRIPELPQALGAVDMRNDGAITMEIFATAWNCPKYITPRFTEAQVNPIVVQLQGQIDDLAAQLAQSAGTGSPPAPAG